MKMTHLLFMTLLLTLVTAAGCRRRPPEEQFAYDLDGLDDTQPSEILYLDRGRIATSLEDPSSLTLDSEDRLYIGAENIIQILTLTGGRVRTIGVDGTPRCLTVAEDGKVYAGIADHVEVFSPDGTREMVWPASDSRSFITGIAIIGDSAFVADAGNRVVTRHALDGSPMGTITGKNRPEDKKGFIIPSPFFDVAPGRDDSLWVVNPGRHRLENYSPEGELKTSWGKAAMSNDGFCGCCNPTHIALFDNGSFLTAEKGLVRVKVYGPDGVLRGLVASPRSFGNDGTIMGMAIDSTGRVLVLDNKLPAVRVFVKATES